jgi:hypothetical protein
MMRVRRCGRCNSEMRASAGPFIVLNDYPVSIRPLSRNLQAIWVGVADDLTKTRIDRGRFLSRSFFGIKCTSKGKELSDNSDVPKGNLH